MRTSVDIARERMTHVHHKYYPNVSPEDFYTNILADLLHFNDTMKAMGKSEQQLSDLRNEATKLYNLDRRATEHQERETSCPKVTKLRKTT